LILAPSSTMVFGGAPTCRVPDATTVLHETHDRTQMDSNLSILPKSIS
jgi:hypothetical protein